MYSATVLSALSTAAIFTMASAASSSSIDLIPTPTPGVVGSAFTEVGCFSTAEPLENHGPYEFQSLGNCQLICTMLDKPVLGLVDGTDCWCGDLIPPKDAQVSNSSCDTSCAGIDADNCGGPSKWWIVLTGTTRNRIDNYDPSSASSSSSSSVVKATSSTPAPAKTSAAETVMVTASGSAAPKSSGPNTTGIAVGVVVGVLALAAIVGGVVLFLRRKRRQQVEEEYRRQAAISSFTQGGKLHTSNSSMTDSRLDPEFMNRRASNGSIADNEDYSRRILKVTNA